mgnify:FL=1|tara:strand:+ start:1913 stop:2260 length:348 start_codon:yes stop_codon:yes gene_type:complete
MASTSFSVTIGLTTDQGEQITPDTVEHIVMAEQIDTDVWELFTVARGIGLDSEGYNYHEEVLVFQGVSTDIEDTREYFEQIGITCGQRAIGWFQADPVESYHYVTPMLRGIHESR